MEIEMGDFVLYNFAFYFLIYAFFGWCGEVAFAAIKKGEFVNRGFLAGPVCPIYGIGVCVVILCLEPLRENVWALYVGAVVLTSVLEYITGYILENLFHQKWWDYSDQPFNIKGYVCLSFSLVWGVGCVFVVYMLHRFVSFAVGLIPYKIGIAVLCILFAVFAADVCYTVAQMMKLRRIIDNLHDMEITLRKFSDRIGEEIADRVFAAAEKKERAEQLAEELKEKYRAQHEELMSKHAEQRAAFGEFKFDEFKARYKKLAESGHSRIEHRIIKSFPHISTNTMLMRFEAHGKEMRRLKREKKKTKKSEKLN